MTPQEIETRKAETAAAYELGAKAVHVALDRAEAEGLDMTDITKERVLMLAFENDNPFKMVGWGDPGHQRPAWFEGFNDHLRSYFGLKTPRWKVKDDEDSPRELNGRLSDGRIDSYTAACYAAVRISTEQGARFWPEDRGSHVSPRYAIFEAFQIGEPVSYAFNGDYYPCGRIVAMSGQGDAETGYRIITVRDHTGRERKFWRRRKTSSWKEGETWGLVRGWHNDQNPHF